MYDNAKVLRIVVLEYTVSGENYTKKKKKSFENYAKTKYRDDENQ